MKKLIVLFSVSVLMLSLLTLSISAKNVKKPIRKPLKPLHLNESRIINGVQATLGQVPEQVHMIGYRDPAGLSLYFYCGGIIIRADWVLTAAHCVVLLPVTGSVRFRAGIIDINNPGPYQQSILVLVAGNTYVHSAYNDVTLENDIGLIRATTQFDLSGPYVKAANLPSPRINMEEHVGEQLTISGFGITAFGATQISPLLLVANLNVISNAQCRAYPFVEAITDTVFCGQDTTQPISATCQGDSGGPITIMIGSTRTLVGIVSFGPDETCGVPPSGFTHVPSYITWITDVQNRPILPV